MKKIILTGGGTAGHVMPNIAMLPELKKHFDEIYYMGTNAIEKEIAKQNGIKFFEFKASKLARKKFFKNFLIFFKFIKSIKECKKILKEQKPNIVFSKGGYVSLPVVIASKKLNIPVVTHESDLSFGLANKVISKFADVILTSFSSTAKKNPKCVFVGNPIRKEILNGSKSNAIEVCKFSNNQKKVIMFFGGSLGAKVINDIVIEMQTTLEKNYNIIHITGKDNKTKIKSESYYQTQFAKRIEDLYALADIVVCRGGANSIFELLAIKKPMIIIPLTKKVSRGDQIENAKYFQKMGWAKMILQEELSKESLMTAIKEINITKMQKEMERANANDANKKIIIQILRYCK